MVDQLTLGIIIAAAAADSINPCVFGVLIFMLAFMCKVFKSKSKMVLAAAFYIVAVYITYFLMGLGIFAITWTANLSKPIYWIAAIIAILAGFIEIKDFFWYGQGLSLQIFPGGAKRIKMYVNKFKKYEAKHKFAPLLAAFGLGVFVPFVELPCTGAPYFAIIALLTQGSYATAIPLLLLYNLVFIAPLFVIVGLMYFGTKSKAMEKWRLKNRGLMRLGMGLFLVALGSYMIWSVI